MAISSNDIILPAIEAVVIFLMIIYTAWQSRKNAKYARFQWFNDMLDQCMNEGKPLGVVIDKANRGIPFVCNVSEKNSSFLKGPHSPQHPQGGEYTLLTPAASQTKSLMKMKGLPEMAFFPMPRYFAYGIQESASLCQMGKKIEKHPRLSNWNNSLKMIELASNNSASFYSDVRDYVKSAVEYNLEHPHSDKIVIPYTPRGGNN